MTTMTDGLTDDLGREVGERIHAVMWRQKVSQIRMAPVLGLTQPTLSKKSRGDLPWWLAEVFTAAQLLGVTVDERCCRLFRALRTTTSRAVPAGRLELPHSAPK